MRYVSCPETGSPNTRREGSATKVESIYQTEYSRPVGYGFEGKDVEGKEVEVYISADGKFLN
jgi:hypothetical protein